MKKSFSLTLSLALVLMSNSVLAASFTDTKGHWAQAYIEDLSVTGIIKGYPDQTFKPDNEISYVEFISLFNRSFLPGFEVDTRGEKWYSHDLKVAREEGYLPGDFFKNPDKTISRQEAAFLIASYLDLKEDAKALERFSDRDSIKYSKEVSALTSLGILHGNEKGQMAPQAPLTRGQVAKIFVDLKKKTLRLYDKEITADKLQSYPAEFALLKEDIVVKSRYTFTDNGAGTILYGEEKNPVAYKKNDLVRVFAKEGEKTKFSFVFNDYPHPIASISLDKLDFSQENIRERGNQVILDRADLFDKPQGKNLGPISSVGIVKERRGQWICLELFGSAQGEAWVKKDAIQVQASEKDSVLDWK